MCNSLAFRPSVLLRLLLDRDTYGGVDPLSVFALFLKKVDDIIAPKLSIIFRTLSFRFRSVRGLQILIQLLFTGVLHLLI